MATSQQPEAQFHDYEVDFDPSAYLQIYYGSVDLKSDNDCTKQLLDHLYEAFNTVKENPSGTALDFGCGPTIFGAVYASRKVSNIVCADLVDGCRNEILKWINHDSDSFDWLPYIEYLSQKEGIESDELEKRTRSSIQHIIHCDALLDKPLGDSPPLAPYDVIIACGVLCTACLNKEMFVNAIKKVCCHLKPKGLFILGGFLNESSYSFGDPPKTFGNFNYKEEDVKGFLEAAGMKIVSMTCFKGLCWEKDVAQPGAKNITYEINMYVVTSQKIAEQ